MQVILKQDIKNLGTAGDAVSVTNGYARNFLLARGLALLATAANLKIIEKQRQKAKLRQAQEKKQAEELAKKLVSVSCTISMQVGEDDKLFGSVTNQDIANAYKAEGIDIDKRKIEVVEPIKEVGVFKIKIKLHPQVSTEAKVWVIKE